MNIKLDVPSITDLKPRITVIGVGGAGCNAVNNMIASGLRSVDFVVANTDAQSLAMSSAEQRIQLGLNLTEGLGAGAKPEIGQAAAEEAVDELRAQISGSHMVFIACGMGGGTGTGAASVIARVARECDALTVGIVTKPFLFEGTRRMRMAEAGVEELRKWVDTLIVIPNQNLFRIANEKTTFAEAFILADQVLYSGIACVVDLIMKEGLINLDFADVRTVMSGMGTAMMGTGEAEGERRATIAAEEAISNPLLDDISLRGAKGLLVSIIGGRDLTLYEVDEAASRVRREVDPEANIIVGAACDESLGDRIRVSIVASGVFDPAAAQDRPAFTADARPQSFQYAPKRGAPPPSPAAPGGARPVPAFPAATGEGRAKQAASRRPPPMPPAEPGFTPPSPEEADAFARALTEAIEQADGPSPGAWQAPGDVLIEEGVSEPDPIEDRPSNYQHLPPPAGAHEFTPQAPAPMPRQDRRFPSVDEFPEVGQRDYRAKKQQQAGGDPAQSVPPPRRPGLFERITSFGRRDDSYERPAEAYPQGHGGHRAASPDEAGARQAHEGRRDLRRERHDRGEHVELPGFFGRPRR